MIREKIKLTIKKAHHNIDDPLGELDRAVDKLCDEHEAQLRDLEYKLRAKEQIIDKKVFDIKSKDKEIDRLKYQNEKLYIYKCGHGWSKSRSIVAMLFWELRRHAIDTAWCKFDQTVELKRAFDKAYAMLKGKT